MEAFSRFLYFPFVAISSQNKFKMESTKKFNNKPKTSTREELNALDKDVLIEKILKLEAHNFQLQQTLKNIQNSKESVQSEHKGNQKAFDFSKYHKRHIFLKFYYLGWNHHGFVIQEDTQNTIENHLFSALQKSCLIESRETSNYHRCGRTDKGVSAFSQVMSLDIRSRLEPDRQDKLDEEMPYCKILNRLLPKSIRCVSWCPAGPEMSARFDCKHRVYKYFFPRGSLNVDAMNQGAKYLIGSHDFRNLCKMDVGNGVVNFERTILDASVTCDKLENDGSVSGYDMCSLTIKSQAFLWHQIRCIMGVLIIIGREKEKPEVIQDLFNIEKCPRKPQYSMAHELPLNLYYCEYENDNWFIDNENLISVIRDLQEDWTLNTIKSTMIRNMLTDLSTDLNDIEFQDECLLQGAKSKIHQPLLSRNTCESLQNRIEHFAKKRKLDAKQNEAPDEES